MSLAVSSRGEIPGVEGAACDAVAAPTTTDRYLSSKLRPEEFERLDRAFGVLPDRETADENVEPR